MANMKAEIAAMRKNILLTTILLYGISISKMLENWLVPFEGFGQKAKFRIDFEPCEISPNTIKIKSI